MNTITITDLADVREGDIVTFEYEGYRYTGPTYGASFDSSVGALCVTGLILRTVNGLPSSLVTFISATREVVDLPTEPNAVIRDVEVKGHVRIYPLGRRTAHGWELFDEDGILQRSVYPKFITAWTPAEVVVTGERVTR